MRTTSTAHVAVHPGSGEANVNLTDARLELLESLPVRLNESDLNVVVALANVGATTKAIGCRLSLDPLVVEVELRRADARAAMQHPLTREQQREADREAAMPHLDALEMNRLARGTHIPNVQLRGIIMRKLAEYPELSLSGLLKRIGYSSTSHGRRQLGWMRHSGCSRIPQTIRPADAARVVRELGVEPREVIGL
jgi:hypothetical protein